MKRAKERDSSETAAIKINRRKVCLLIIAIGLNMLGITKLKVMNYLPAIFLPIALCHFL